MVHLRVNHNRGNIVSDFMLQTARVNSPKVLSWCLWWTFIFDTYLYLASETSLMRISLDYEEPYLTDGRPSHSLQPAV